MYDYKLFIPTQAQQIFKKMDLTQKVDVLDYTGLKDFNEQYFKPQKPVVIKGLADNKIAGKRWKISYFKETMGDLDIDVFDNSNKKSASSAFTTPDLKMKFSDYLEIITKNEKINLRILAETFIKELMWCVKADNSKL